MKRSDAVTASLKTTEYATGMPITAFELKMNGERPVIRCQCGAETTIAVGRALDIIDTERRCFRCNGVGFVFLIDKIK